MPGFTRVSAVVVIEEDFHYGSENYCCRDHMILVAHNPFACHPLSAEIFRDYVQFMDVGNGYGWSDGEPL